LEEIAEFKNYAAKKPPYGAEYPPAISNEPIAVLCFAASYCWRTSCKRWHDCMDSQPQDPQPSGKEPLATPPDGRPIILRSEDLFQSCREVWIEHGEVMYRLRLTASGKLYLTK
jgi:hemin uptake protein HemP